MEFMRGVWRSVGLGLLSGGLVLAGCSSTGKSSGASGRATTSQGAASVATTVRPTTVVAPPKSATTVSPNGPVANVDHWHAAYGIYDCDRYVASIDGSELPDPDGIHTHADGLIHIHPFTQRASGANATLQRFTDAIGIKVEDEQLGVPARNIARKDGDLCPNGKKGTVRVLAFGGATHSDPVEVKSPLSLRLERNQVIAIVFAPADQLIGPPPSMSELDQPADVPVEFALTPERKALIGSEPKVEVPSGRKPTELSIRDIEIGKGELVGPSSKVGVKFVLATWSAGTAIESNWADSAPLLGLALGRDQVVKGFDEGMQGMRVGGLRRIIIPPNLGFGTLGSPPLIGPNETLVLYVRLVALEAPQFKFSGTTIAS